MAKNNHGGRVGKVGVSVGSSRVEIEREYISYRLIQELGLIKQRLAMESRDILIEVDSKKVKTSGAVLDSRLVVLENFVEVIGSFCCDGPNLLVAARIAGDKEDRNTFDLQDGLAKSKGSQVGEPYLDIIINALLAIQVKRVLAREACVLGVEVVEPGVRRPHVRHATSFRVNLTRR